MRSELKVKLLQFLNRNKKSEGFTLIELLVVIIIIGVLSAVALPNLLGQIGKARETEMKQAVGTVNRAQQAQHFEREVFATSAGPLGVAIETGTDVDYLNGLGISNTANLSTSAFIRPSNTDAADDGVRLYAGGIVYNAGNYASVVCQTLEQITGTTSSITAGIGVTATTTNISCTGASLTTLN